MNLRNVLRNAIVGLVFLLPISCAPGLMSKKPVDCTSRVGHCFDASFSGIAVKPLPGNIKLYYEAIARERDASTYQSVRSAEWMVELPTNPKLQLASTPNALGSNWFGDGFKSELEFHDLLESSKKSQNKKTLLVDGAHLASIRASGSKNWDRKYILVGVGERPKGAAVTPSVEKAPADLTYSDFVGVWSETSPNDLLNAMLTFTFSLRSDASCTYHTKAIEKGSEKLILNSTTTAQCEFTGGYLIYRGTDEQGAKDVARFKVLSLSKSAFHAVGSDNQTYTFKAVPD